MPRYHLEFTCADGTVLVDEEGTELPDLAAAKAQARMVIRTVQKDAGPDADWSEWIATVKGAEDDETAVIHFRDVMGLRVA
jgi:hypothetical protein